MEFVIALSRFFLYIILLVNCLQHADCVSFDTTDIVTTEALNRRTIESELTSTSTVTTTESLKLQSSEAQNTEIETNKETTTKVNAATEDNNTNENKRVVSPTSKPIDLLGTQPKMAIRHPSSARAAEAQKGNKRGVRNTHHKLKQIYSKWQLLLAIAMDGRVYGTDAGNDVNTIIEISPGPSMRSLVKLRGRASSLYLCINSTGHQFGSRVPTGECFFQQHYRNDGWTSFSSCAYPSSSKSNLCRGITKRKGWMIALNKDGSPRNAKIENPKKRSTRFLTMDVKRKKSKSR
ncbi:uncharacterized protein [Antedon mediterranea]|uniref:uncharacterized protein n=1 Tax=Antedon mediterranea TaxID=105859 RepID=UPI003AF611EE